MLQRVERFGRILFGDHWPDVCTTFYSPYEQLATLPERKLFLILSAMHDLAYRLKKSGPPTKEELMQAIHALGIELFGERSWPSVVKHYCAKTRNFDEMTIAELEISLNGLRGMKENRTTNTPPLSSL